VNEPRFDTYAVSPPEGDWAYEVDDTGWCGPGWWPLYRDGRPAMVRLALSALERAEALSRATARRAREVVLGYANDNDVEVR